MYRDMYKLLEPKIKGVHRLHKGQERISRWSSQKENVIALFHNNEIVMSDTNMEKRTNMSFVVEAHGDILISGLGIGLIVMAIQDKEEVSSITIVEKYNDVIDIISSQLKFNHKINIINDDIYEWSPPKGIKYDVIYHDIWYYINSDVYEDMKKLKNKFKYYLKSKKEFPNRFQKCWCEYEAKNNMRLF
jgi:16S rRNA A1518/A1519 N6-dimethyltransferase RsmA/KsgA/DIM1 with predicted DNA glycosylase/AP lyase activity